MGIYAASFGGAMPIAVAGLSAMTESYEVRQADYSDAGISAGSYLKWGKLSAGTYDISTSTTNSGSAKYLLHVYTSRYADLVETCTTTLATTMSDPWYGCQWHLNNTGQFDNGAEQDLNVQELWDSSVPSTMGDGILVAVVDDGLDFTHEDLADNVMTSANRNYHVSHGSIFNPVDRHGTAVASMIAARDNSLGVRGVAPRVKVHGVKLISGDTASNANIAAAMVPSTSSTAISNNSWGPAASGRLVRPAMSWETAVVNGVTDGFGGKGVVYVFSAGNGHYYGDYSNLNGFANFYAVTAVCAVNYADKRSGYSERGSNLWVCGPSSDRSALSELAGITSADVGDRYRVDFIGASAAVPAVSGVAALIRAADRGMEPILSWRDVKLILANTARKNDPTNSGWREGAVKYGSVTDRYSFNHEYGFGVVDAGGAVALAKTWSVAPKQREVTGSSADRAQAIPDTTRTGVAGRTVVSTLSVDNFVDFIEFVEINIHFQHTYFANLLVELESPSGKKSSLSVARNVYVANPVNGFFRFGSAAHLGENASVEWKLRVTDYVRGDSGTLHAWDIEVFGHGFSPGMPTISASAPGSASLDVSWGVPPTVADETLTVVASYDLRYIRADATDKGDGRWTTAGELGKDGTLEHSLENLDGLVEYEDQVRAHNDAGPGPWSEVFKATTLDLPPSVPRNISVAARDAALVASWQEPSSSGAKAASYDVRSIESDATGKADPNSWTEVDEVWKDGGGDLRYLIRSLTNGEQYDVQVRAVNDGGEGDWSSTVTGTPVMSNSQPEFPPAADYNRLVDENTAAGMGFGDPVSARDDDSDTLTYSLGSGSDFFDIGEFSGQLLTKSALDHEDEFSYRVSVRVSDLKDSTGVADAVVDDTVTLTVEVGDVDEPPVIMGPKSPTFDEKFDVVVARYTASEREREQVTDWDLEGIDSSKFDVTDGVLEFVDPPDFEARGSVRGNNDYVLTIVAKAGSLQGKYDIIVTVENVNEAPTVSGTQNFDFMEDRGSWEVGNYSASDPENDMITWSLSGPDDDDFAIDEFGQLSFREAPDADRPADGDGDSKYEVNVVASDGRLRGMLDITVNVEDVNERPVIAGETDIDFAENSTRRVAVYNASNPEGGGVIWSLGGTDAARFELRGSTAGRRDLYFRSVPNFEVNESYDVSVDASDGTHTGRLPVTINITDIDERESLGLSSSLPVEGVQLSATLTEADAVTNRRWQWQRSQNRGSGSDIAVGTSSGYTPVSDDVGYDLRVTLTYDDTHGTDRTLTAATSSSVQVAPIDNDPPSFSTSETGQRNVAQNSRHRTAIGDAIAATDPDNDRLSYSINTTHDNKFEIERNTGLLRVGSAANLDREMRDTYSLTVTATDPLSESATQHVTIAIDDVNEPPVAEGDSITTREDTPAAIHVLAHDWDPESADLTVTAPATTRNASLVVEPSGIILFGPKANFNGQDSFTYRITDGTQRATATVIVIVRPVNDAPEFSADPVELEVAKDAEAGDNVGKPVTATDIDGDTPRYTLWFSSEFEIDERSGQITVKQGATIDPMVDSYVVTVTADDQRGQFNSSASVDVTINAVEQVTRITTTIGGGGGSGGGGGPPPIPIRSDEDFDWNVTRDIESLHSDNDLPTGLWSNGEVLWIVEISATGADFLFAYELNTGERLEQHEFELERRNRFSHGIWSNGEIVWLADSGQDKLFAYQLERGERAEDRDLELDERNRDPRGIGSDGELMLVLDSVKDALFAYDLDSGRLLAEFPLDKLNKSPRGIWSDSFTIWVSDDGAKRIFAYRSERETLNRYEDQEFSFRSLLKAGNGEARGIWSDGEVIFVADEQDDQVYTYNLPDAIDARLASLTLSGVEFGEFSARQTDYAAVVDAGLAQTRVEAQAAQDDATVELSPADADGDPTNGHQAALIDGQDITISVTSEDGSRTLVYRVGISHCLSGLSEMRLSSVQFVGGGVGALLDCAQGLGVDALYHSRDGVGVGFFFEAPAFLNHAFRNRFAEGVPAREVLIAKREPIGDTAPAAPSPN